MEVVYFNDPEVIRHFEKETNPKYKGIVQKVDENHYNHLHFRLAKH